MKLIKPSFEIWEQEPGLEEIYKQIERAARVCYKSEENIKEGSAKKMVNALIKSGHGAMLEHGTVYLKSSYDISAIGSWRNSIGYKYSQNPYSKVNESGHGDFRDIFITTNMRVLVENRWLDDLKYLCEPTEYHEKRVTVKFTTSIGITRELIRHRKFSFANESTRYCNYNKSKFNNEITFIKPSWFDDQYTYEIIQNVVKNRYLDEHDKSSFFIRAMKESENEYIFATEELGMSAQEARELLPLATKSELVMTGYIEDWKNFFFLRADDGTGPAHPDMKAIAVPLKEEFIKRNLI